MEVLKGSQRPAKSFYTPEEVKDILRLKDVDTVYLLCRSGELKGAIKIGRYWRIEVNTFNDWIASKLI